MINLLPPTDKQTLETEFKHRLIGVYLLLISSALFIALVLLLPSYFLADVRVKGAEEERSKVIDSAESSERTLITSKLADTKIQLLAVTGTETREPFYVVLDELVKAAGNNVSLDGVSYTRRFAEEDSTLQVTGGAKTRDSLLAFQEALEANELFSEAELPVSALAKDVDISFNIQISGRF